MGIMSNSLSLSTECTEHTVDIVAVQQMPDVD